MKNQINFEKHSNETKSWLNEIAVDLQCEENTEWALNALKAVLHTLRDRTTLQEVFHLSAQLPVLIRGFYLEGYKPTGKPDKMNADQFLLQIGKRMGPGVEVSATDAFRAVLAILYNKISIGEMNDLMGSMPKDIQRLWKSLMPETANEA